MNKEIELIIKKNYIISKQVDLVNIANYVGRKKITYKLQGSKGKMTSEINQLVDQLNDISDAISQLLLNTSKSVANIVTMFEKSDTDMSNAIDRIE